MTAAPAFFSIVIASKTEAGSQKPEAGSWKLRPGLFDLGHFILMPLAILLLMAPDLLSQEPVHIASISFEGNRAISTARLKNFIRNSPEGSSYSAANLESDLQNIRDFYDEGGFLRAQVGPPRVEFQGSGNRKTAAILIPVSEGPIYILKTMAIKNLHILPTSTFMQMSPLTAGKPFSRTKAAQWQAKIIDAYRAIGHLNFRCAAQENLYDKSNVVEFILDCTEGNPYSVGRINIVGDDSIHPNDFKKRLLISEGGVFNPDLLAYSIQFVNEMHIYRPISNADVELRIDPKTCTVDITWHLTLLGKNGK